MKPTIYKPSIYKGAGIYKIGAEGGGGGVNIDITKYQGSRSTPSVVPDWPNGIGSQQNRVCSQPLDLSLFIGKKIKILVEQNFNVGAIDGTASYQPYNEYAWASGELEFTIEYGIVTISIRKNDNSNITPDDVNVSAVLLNA